MRIVKPFSVIMGNFLIFTLLFVCADFVLAQDDPQDIAAIACNTTVYPYEFNDEQGIIQTANFPDVYNNYEDCLWYINPTNVEGKMIYLEVDTFETEDGQDMLRVYKGQSTDSEDLLFDLSGTYPYGYYLPTSETSVTLKFHSDGSFSYAGINMTYYLEDLTPVQLVTQVACNATLQPAVLDSSNSTVIESIDYPLNYETGGYCVWTLMPENPPGGGFYLSVISFETGADSLNIYFSDSVDGGDFDTTWTGTLGQGYTLYANSEVVSLEFSTASTQPGFQIVYFLSSEACQSSSAETITVDGYGELISPGYPYSIPDHIYCNWILRAADDQKISLTALDFSLHGDGENCNNEYLEILNGAEGDAISIGKFCGNSTFGSFPSSSSAIQLVFNTHEDIDDSSYVPYGFKLSFEPY